MLVVISYVLAILAVGFAWVSVCLASIMAVTITLSNPTNLDLEKLKAMVLAVTALGAWAFVLAWLSQSLMHWRWLALV